MNEGSAKANEPATLATPPVRVELLKAWPAVMAEAVGGVVMTGVPWAMVNARVALPVPPRFVAVMVALEFPAVVGVPEMTPVVVFTVSPAGKPVAPKEAGELLAVMV